VSAKIAIIVVAYNAATTLAKVLDRIPHDFRHRISAVYVGDDHSGDSTHLVALGYQQLSELPLHVVRHERNLGYGGNQKAGYAWAHENGMDIVVLLHGDGQYAPEILPDIVAPLIEGRADAVFGSRMMSRGAARAGGMPMYKYVGNRILTSIENKLAGAELTEWHSGYRAYSVEALAAIPVERNSDGFDFDTEVIVQLIEAGRRIVEIPIPTYYGDEICHVNGMRYAKDVVEDVARYRLHKIGFGTGELAFNSVEYEHKHGANSSHSQLIAWGTARPPGRVLDLGCGSGSIAAALREAGHHVVGVDLAPAAGVDEAVDEFVSADLDNGLPPSVTSLEPFDLVVLVDLTWSAEEEAFRAEVRAWLETELAVADRHDDRILSGDTAEGFAQHLDWERTLFDDRLRRGVVARGVRRARRQPLWEWLIFEEEYYRAGGPSGSPRTASSCWPPPSSSSARPSSRPTSSRAWPRPRTCGARAGPSPTPAPTWRRSPARPPATTSAAAGC
jgi:glycosyltransferase involved in cell wall biosynthesis